MFFKPVIYSGTLRDWVRSLTRLPDCQNRSSGQVGDKLIADIKPSRLRRGVASKIAQFKSLEDVF